MNKTGLMNFKISIQNEFHLEYTIDINVEW